MADGHDNLNSFMSNGANTIRVPAFSMADTLKHLKTNKGGDRAYEAREFLHKLDEVLNNGDFTAEGKVIRIVQLYHKFSSANGNDPDIVISIADRFIQRGWGHVNVENLERLYSEIVHLSDEQKEQWYKCTTCALNYPEEKFQCTSCDETFFHFVSLQFHISRKHVSLAANSNLSCPECGVFFNRDISSMKTHYEKEHLCARGHEICPVGCKTLLPVNKNPESSVFQHVANKHVCTICNEKTLDTISHLLLFHNVAAMPETEDATEMSLSQRSSPQNNFSDDFASLRTEGRDVRRMGNIQSNAKKDMFLSEKGIPCHICGFRIPLEGFPCKLCPEKFDYYVDALMHSKKQHKMILDFEVECEVCKISSGISEMHYHLTTKHSCPSAHLRCPRNCQELFISEIDIMQHMQNVHSIGNSSRHSLSDSKQSLSPEISRLTQSSRSNSYADKERSPSDYRSKSEHTKKRLEQIRPNVGMLSKSVHLMSELVPQNMSRGSEPRKRPKSFAEWEDFIKVRGPLSLGLPGFLLYLAPIQRISKVSSGSRNKMKCGKCKLRYPRNLLSCAVCDDVFCTPGSLALHEEFAHDSVIDELFCACCSKPFQTVNDLLAHELANVCNNHYECPFGCDCLFGNQIKLSEHVKNHHAANSSPSTENMIPFALTTYKRNLSKVADYSCEKCKLICLPSENWSQCKLCENKSLKLRIRYINGVEFLAHLVRHHKLNVSMRLICATCKVSVADVLDFHNHQKSAHGFCSLHDVCSSMSCGVVFPYSMKDIHIERCQHVANDLLRGTDDNDCMRRMKKEEQLFDDEPFSLSKPNVEKQIVTSLQEKSLKKSSNELSYGISANDESRLRVRRKRTTHELVVNRSQNLKSVSDLMDETMDYAATRKTKRSIMPETYEHVGLHPDYMIPHDHPNQTALTSFSILGPSPLPMFAEPKVIRQKVIPPALMDQKINLNTPISVKQRIDMPVSVKQKRDLQTVASQRKLGKCKNCRYRYEIEAMKLDHHCEECNLYFIKEYELMIHLTVVHAVETDLSTRFACDLCPQGSTMMDINDLLAHRSEKHEACLTHMRCSNGPCKYMFSNVEEMQKHSKELCMYKNHSRSEAKVGSKEDPRNAILPKTRAEKKPERRVRNEAPRVLKRDKSPSETRKIKRPSDHASEKRQGIVSFDESKQFFKTLAPKSSELTTGCSVCGQVKPSDKYFECTLCTDPTTRVSEKQFALFLDALLHLVKTHGFVVVDVNQSCKSPECINEFGEQLFFDSIEEYHFHGVNKHGLCEKHMLCPYGCGEVFNHGKLVSVHVRTCPVRNAKLTLKTV